MSVETATRGILIADAGVEALIDTRVYPVGGVPQGAETPYVEYSKASREYVRTHDGPVPTNRYTMDLTAWATSYAAAQAVAVAMLEAINGHRGTSGGVAFLGVFDDGQSDDQEIPQHAEERGLAGASLTLSIWSRDI